jgi:hypothetical protein
MMLVDSVVPAALLMSKSCFAKLHRDIVTWMLCGLNHEGGIST